MARISGVDLPRNKRIEYALPYIMGIGLVTAQKVLTELDIEFDTRVKDLSEDEVVRLRTALGDHVVEGDLRRRINQDIRRLKEINAYRGQRHRRNLPVRGQRTHTNARTKKGKRIAVAGKKKATK